MADGTELGISLNAHLGSDGLFDVVVDIVIHRLVDTLSFGVNPSDFHQQFSLVMFFLFPLIFWS